jgi:hypothetical protein
MRSSITGALIPPALSRWTFSSRLSPSWLMPEAVRARATWGMPQVTLVTAVTEIPWSPQSPAMVRALFSTAAISTSITGPESGW